MRKAFPSLLCSIGTKRVCLNAMYGLAETGDDIENLHEHALFRLHQPCPLMV